MYIHSNPAGLDVERLVWSGHLFCVSAKSEGEVNEFETFA